MCGGLRGNSKRAEVRAGERSPGKVVGRSAKSWIRTLGCFWWEERGSVLSIPCTPTFLVNTVQNHLPLRLWGISESQVWVTLTDLGTGDPTGRKCLPRFFYHQPEKKMCMHMHACVHVCVFVCCLRPRIEPWASHIQGRHFTLDHFHCSQGSTKDSASKATVALGS